MIKIVGIGPGHKDYLLPIAKETIIKAQCVIGGRRHLEAMKDYIKGTSLVLDLSEKGMEKQVEQALLETSKLTVYLVSGDPMFYSLFDAVKRASLRIDGSQVPEAIAGISSLQYMFNRIGMPYSKASFISLHGREVSIEKELQHSPVLGILTDRVHSIAWIGKALEKAGYEDIHLWLGERLSYEDECIRKVTLEEAGLINADPLSVVVVDVQR